MLVGHCHRASIPATDFISRELEMRATFRYVNTWDIIPQQLILSVIHHHYPNLHFCHFIYPGIWKFFMCLCLYSLYASQSRIHRNVPTTVQINESLMQASMQDSLSLSAPPPMQLKPSIWLSLRPHVLARRSVCNLRRVLQGFPRALLRFLPSQCWTTLYKWSIHTYRINKSNILFVTPNSKIQMLS